MKKIKWGVMGTAFICERSTFPGMLQAENCEMYAIAGRSMEKADQFKEKYGFEKAYGSYEELLTDPEIEAVYIPLPNTMHYEWTIKALKSGKHVLCEKPVASNEKELQAMLAAAKEHGVVFMEAMKLVINPAFDAIMENLPKLGKIRRVTFQMCQYSSRYDKFKNGIIENAFRPELSNGSLMDVGVYCVHPMVKILGKPDRVTASCVKLHNGVDGMGTILASYDEQGAQAELLYSKITDSPVPSQIQGEEGTMYMESLPIITKVWIRYRDKSREDISFELKDPGNNMNYEIAEFMRIAEANGSAETHNQYSVWEMQVMDEARRQMGIVFPADRV